MDPKKKIKLAKKRLELEKAKTERKNKVAKQLLKEQEELKSDLKVFQEGILSKLIELEVSSQEQSRAVVGAIVAIDSSENLEGVQSALKSLETAIGEGVKVKNIKDAKAEVKVEKVKVETQKIEIPKNLATNEDIKKVVSVLEVIEEKLKPSQRADQFAPFRRVVKVGDKFQFDDNFTGAGSGGGGGSSSGSSGLTDDELRATPVETRHGDGTYDANIGKLTTLTGVATASGDTTILAVAGGSKVLIYALSFVPTTSSTTDRDVLIKLGSTTVVGWRTVTAGGGYAESYKNDQWIEGADGEDIVINLSGADSIRYNFKYKLVAA